MKSSKVCLELKSCSMIFLIIGRGDTLKRAVIDYDQNLSKFLERARERNLKLKAEKMRFRLQEVPFIGHMLTADGLAPGQS